jgi:hypothetical protein
MATFGQVPRRHTAPTGQHPAPFHSRDPRHYAAYYSQPIRPADVARPELHAGIAGVCQAPKAVFVGTAHSGHTHWPLALDAGSGEP